MIEHAATHSHNTADVALGRAVGLVCIRNSDLMFDVMIGVELLQQVGCKRLGAIVAHGFDILVELVGGLLDVIHDHMATLGLGPQAIALKQTAGVIHDQEQDGVYVWRTC